MKRNIVIPQPPTPMNLPHSTSKRVVETALSFLGLPYSENFRCLDFVRTVFRQMNMNIPILHPNLSPPSDWNISETDINNPPPGHIMFLIDPNDSRKERAWTHAVIIVNPKDCIHCSIFFGREVIISPLDKIFEKYKFAPSIRTAQ